MELKQHFDAALTALGPEVNIHIAYSGGLDSHCLLHLTAAWAIQHGREVTALHLNHGLSVNADQWRVFCQGECERLGVKFLSRQTEIDPTLAGSLEQTARERRYAWFESVLGEGDVLLLAHHQEDQAETLLLRLLRGAGTRGLSAIPAARPLGKGRLVRPLLDTPQDELLRYARCHKLEWVEDESNLSLDMDRNYLRHQVMPVLGERWSRVAQNFSRSASNLREDQALLDELADIDAQSLRLASFSSWMDATEPLDVSGFRALTASRQRNLLQYLLKPLSIYPLPMERLQEWLRQVQGIDENGKARLVHETIQMAVYDGRMHFLSGLLEPAVTLQRIEWKTDASLSLASSGMELRLISQPEHLASGVAQRVFTPGDTLDVFWRQGGERVSLAGEEFSRSLKKLLHVQRVAPWLRASMPLVSCQGSIVWSAVLGDLSPRLVGSAGQLYSIKLIMNGVN